MANIKDMGLPRLTWDTPPFLLIVSPTLPVQSVDAYVRTLGQSRDNQTKSGWPYSMSMGLCPRYNLNQYNLNQTINLYSTIQLTLEHIRVTFQGKAKWFYKK